VLLVIDDVTQHRVLTEQLNRASKMESIGRLAGGVAHDFNNILTGIIGHTEMLLEQSGQHTTIHNKLGKVRDLSNRATQLTRQLLAFGRRQPMQLSILNLNDLVEEVSKMFQRVLGEDIQLELRLAPKLGSVLADPDQIEQTLMSLAINARDAMPNGGRLTIETANVRLDQEYAGQHHNVQPGPHVMFSVSDTGCGMSPEVLSHLFEPFFTTKPPGKGTGLGLASVYGIVQQHKGSIEVQSRPNAGATFRIFLPRVRGKPQPRQEVDVAEVQTRGTETILLVEDEQAVRELAESVLKEKGYTVYSSAHPSEAEALAARRGEEIALLLSDVVLPECSGPKLYQQLSPKYPALKVLYISGYSHQSLGADSQETVSFKPDGAGKLLLRKPFTPTELAAKVRAVLDAKPVREKSHSSPERQTRRSK
jgi:nitrogen-specific signal transduction histidine kinase/FixJ family two-component response regulator